MSQAAPRIVDLIIEARWVLPMQPVGAVLDDHAVVVQAETIVDVLPKAEAHSRYQPSEIVRLPEHALLPGFVNAHTHNPMTLLRGVADDLPLMTWLEQHIWPVEAKVMGAEFVRDGTELAIAEMLRGGTTCTNENYFFPDVSAETYQRHGFRACVGLPLVEFATAWASEPAEYFARGAEVADQVAGMALVDVAFAPHAPYTVSDASFRQLEETTRASAMRVHLHLLETAREVEDSMREHRIGPIGRLAALGLLDSRLTAVHMTAVNDEDIAACAEARVAVVHCPESNLKLASGFCPVERIRQAGITVAIGTDGCASNNDLDMLGETRTAALLAKAVAGEASALPAADALRAATLGGAEAMGLGDLIGSIEPGKQADLAAIRLSGVECEPMYDLASQLVYASGRHQVSDVWIAGARRLASRELVGIDVSDVLRRAHAWRNRIAAM